MLYFLYHKPTHSAPVMSTNHEPTISKLTISKDRIETIFRCLREQPDKGVYVLIKPIIDVLQPYAGMWFPDNTTIQDPFIVAIMLSAVALGAHHCGNEDLAAVFAAHAESTLTTSRETPVTRLIAAALILAQLYVTQGYNKKSQLWPVHIAPMLFRSICVQRLLFLKELNVDVTRIDEFGVGVYSIWFQLLLHNGNLNSTAILQHPSYTETIRLLQYYEHIPDAINLRLVQDASYDNALVGTDELVRRLLSEFHANYQRQHPVIAPDRLEHIEGFACQLLRSNQVVKANQSNFSCFLAYCTLAIGARFARLDHLLQHFKGMVRQHMMQPVDTAGDAIEPTRLSIMAAWLFSDCGEEA